jgi:restriction endonuclease S subunit
MAKSSWDWNAFRLAVIEAGIRGELTAEWRAANPDVEPAHVLLERIAEEKSELIRTKQIRKEKPLSPISPDEVPFDIPSSWEFERVGGICGLINGKAFKPSDWEAEGLPIIRIQNLNNPNATFNRCSQEVDKRFHVNEGDVLFAWSGTPGTSFGAHIWSGSKALLNQHIYRLQFYAPVNRQFFVFAMNSRLDWLIGQAYGAAGLKHVKKGEVSALEIPFPPPSEQQEIVRILSALDSGDSDGPVHPVVARIQKLEQEFRALANEYESQEKWLADLRSALLQEAISGQLTADWRTANPDVEPAHVLLERIAEEKAELIRTKHIRKEKPLPPIALDEVPFDIPSTWEWTRLDAVSSFRNGKAHEQHFNPDGAFALVNARLVSTGGVVSRRSDVALTPLFIDEIALVMSDVPNGRALSRAFLVPEDNSFTLNQRVAGITPHAGMFPRFLLRVLDRNDHLLAYDNGHRQTHLRKDAIRECPIALPPPAEQVEISLRLEVQLEKVKGLQEELERSKEVAQVLMKSKLAEVFEPVMAD